MAELTRAEMAKESVQAPKQQESEPGYWHGSAAGIVNYWRDRALRAEAALTAARAAMEKM
jgi:hypothetical protein